MADKQRNINYRGTTQQERTLKSLLPDSTLVDERSLADLLAFAAAYSHRVLYTNEKDESYVKGEKGEVIFKNWGDFFAKDISVYWANVLTTDLSIADKKIQEGFLRILQLKEKTESNSQEKQEIKEAQRDNFVNLLTDLVDLLLDLNKWYQEGEKLKDLGKETRIEIELERAINGDLGEKMIFFFHLLDQISKDLELQGPALDTCLEKIALVDDFLRPKQTSHMITWKEGGDLSENIEFAGGYLQEFYRRLFFTMAYILEMAPGLLEESLEKKNDHQPEIGLFIAFLKLYAHAQTHLNSITRRHLDFYYQTILKQGANVLIPDESILCLTLADHMEEYLLRKGTKFAAGVNEAGVSSYYEAKDDVVINRVKVKDLRTLFISKNPMVKIGSSYRLVSAIYAAPFANSMDGQGKPFEIEDHSWPLLGEDQFDKAVIDRQMQTSTLGFALASPVLQLGEGEREINIEFKFTSSSFSQLNALMEDIALNAEKSTAPEDVFDRVLGNAFRLFVSGLETWIPIERYTILPPNTSEGESDLLRLRFYLKQADPAITGYQAEVLGGVQYDTQWPVLRVVLSDSEAVYGYSFLRDLQLERIKIKARVTGLRSVTVSNDQSLLDASAPFNPFGTLPRKNSYFLIGCVELFNKAISELKIHLDWSDLPDDEGGWKTYYQAYKQGIDQDSFRVKVSALSDFGFYPKKKLEREEIQLFEVIEGEVPAIQERKTIEKLNLKKLKIRPQYDLVELEPYTNRTRTGYLKLSISNPPMVFGHALYPRIFSRAVIENAKPRPFSIVSPAEEELSLPNEPYTPLLDRLVIDYEAESEIIFNQLELRENIPEADNKFFRLHPFGMETVYAKQRVKSPYLFPQFDEDGYLFIGLDEVKPPQEISLFFRIKESKKQFSDAPIEIGWHYLKQEEWVAFEADQILSDSTEKLSTTGIVRLWCPPDFASDSNIMPNDKHWIRVTASGNLDIVGRCDLVSTQAVEINWIDNGDENHLLIPGKNRPPIEGLAVQVTAIEDVMQMLPFYGGCSPEDHNSFYVRISERLRHKNRAISLWDIERMVLDKFPQIHQAKCIGRLGHEDLLRTGEVKVVVIPEIKGMDPEPKVGFHTLKEIEAFLSQVSSPFSKIHVINPSYEKVKVSCGIRLKAAYEKEVGKSWQEIHDSILHFICPWLKEGAISLGGSVSKNELLSVLSEHPRVQFVTGFSLVQIYEKSLGYYDLADTASEGTQRELLVASLPWSILVPVAQHQIDFLDEEQYLAAAASAIEEMRLETDFVVLEDDKLDGEITAAFDRSREADDEDEDDDFDIPLAWLG